MRLTFARVVALLPLMAVLLFASGASAEKLRVYTKPIEPFSFQQNGEAVGFSIDLWDRIAKETDLEYEIVWVDTVGDVITALKDGKADVGVAAVSITSEREGQIDFTTPFYESGLSILVDAQGGGATDAIIDAVWSLGFLKLMGVLTLLLVITAHLVWFFERKANTEQFPEPYLQGIWESAWWAISTILSGGCDAKGPMVIGGRIVGAFWMLICIIVITYFTAAITTIMTVNQLSSDINGPGDLPGQRVATVKGSTAEKYLGRHRAQVIAFPTIDEAYAALGKKDVKAVVYDAPILYYHVKNMGGGNQQVVGRLFERQNYGIGLQQNSPHRKAINSALLKLRENGYLEELHTKWFGAEE
jgi:polar amino acid transport system substrate-binding protein